MTYFWYKGAYLVKNSLIPQGEVILIDALITTRSSIQEGIRALKAVKSPLLLRVRWGVIL